MGRAGAGLALLALLAGCGPGPSRSAKRLFLITSDTLRADHLHYAGYPRATSPHLDALAERAWRFDRAIAVIPRTGPSFASMFSGQAPQEHGVQTNARVLPADLPWLPAILGQRGYFTAAFIGNPVLGEAKGYARGFERYELHFDVKTSVTRVKEAFLAWAREHDWTRPTFVWVHFVDPHGPYRPPPDLVDRFWGDELMQSDPRTVELDDRPEGGMVLGRVPTYQRFGADRRVASYVARYDAEIVHMDRALGEVLGFLRERELFDSGLVVFTSDHGESLGENDYYFDHGWSACEATLRVPLLIKLPGQQEGRRVEGAVSTLDLAPTLLALLEGDPASELPSLFDPDDGEVIVIQNGGEYPEQIVGLRTPQWKYLRQVAAGADRYDPAAPVLEEKLYDLSADPGEATDLREERPEMAATLRERLDRLLGEASRSAGAR